MSLSELEWVVAGYALTFAAFMLTGGKLADFFGRRLIFMVGLAVFTGACLACGLAPNGGFLIGARVVQGLGGALMNPATLSIITATFPPRERGKAIGIWAGVSAMALAIGPLVGGLLTEHVNWNWIFFINVPVGIIGLLAIPLFIDESRDTSHEQRLDVPGLATSAIGLFSLTYAFIEANNYGWTSGRILGAFGRRGGLAGRLRAARAAPAGADARPVAVPQPHVLRRERARCSSSGSRCSGRSSTSRSTCRTCSATRRSQAGASFLPMTLLIILIAPRAGALTDRIGSRWLVGVGMTLLAVMLFYYSQLGASESFWAILPGLLIGGVGMGSTMTPVTAAAMSAVAVDKAGVGSAVLNSSRQVGGSLGIAVMGAIVAAGSDFLTGFHDALRVGALLCLVGAVVVGARRPQDRAPAPGARGGVAAEAV